MAVKVLLLRNNSSVIHSYRDSHTSDSLRHEATAFPGCSKQGLPLNLPAFVLRKYAFIVHDNQDGEICSVVLPAGLPVQLFRASGRANTSGRVQAGEPGSD